MWFYHYVNDFTKCQVVTIMPKTYVTKKVIKATKKKHDCYSKNIRNLGSLTKYLLVVPLSNLTSSGDGTVLLRCPELCPSKLNYKQFLC